MKQLTKIVNFKIAATFFLFSFIQTIVCAQDSSSGSSSTVVTHTHTETQAWYAEPWVWIVGGIAFILLIIALVGRNRSVTSISSTGKGTDGVTVTKTTSSE